MEWNTKETDICTYMYTKINTYIYIACMYAESATPLKDTPEMWTPPPVRALCVVYKKTKLEMRMSPLIRALRAWVSTRAQIQPTK